MGHGKGSWFLSSVLFALLLSVSAAQAQEGVAERPLSVTYGPKALAQEGDDDHREVILLSVPEGTSDRLYLRVFDPDLGGDHDLIYGKPDTEARYTVYGKADAPLITRRFGADPATDGKWATVGDLDPADAQIVDGRRVFRLVVEGTGGDDANLFTATVSSARSPQFGTGGAGDAGRAADGADAGQALSGGTALPYPARRRQPDDPQFRRGQWRGHVRFRVPDTGSDRRPDRATGRPPRYRSIRRSGAPSRLSYSPAATKCRTTPRSPSPTRRESPCRSCCPPEPGGPTSARRRMPGSKRWRTATPSRLMPPGPSIPMAIRCGTSGSSAMAPGVTGVPSSTGSATGGLFGKTPGAGWIGCRGEWDGPAVQCLPEAPANGRRGR